MATFILPVLRNKARDSQLESRITNNGQENFTALKLAILGTQLQYSKIKLVDQFRSASVCDDVIMLYQDCSRNIHTSDRKLCQW